MKSMDIIDFIIGLTLMNAMPHLVLGIWKGRMFSAFGFGDARNILYAVLNFIISISLFVYKYGMEGSLKIPSMPGRWYCSSFIVCK